MTYTEYNTSTGELGGVHKGCASADEALGQIFLPTMDGVVAGEFNRSIHYVLDGEITERPASPVTRTDLTLHDVPNGATLTINGESYAAEGTVELEFPLPGTYALRVECFPFLDWADEVTV